MEANTNILLGRILGREDNTRANDAEAYIMDGMNVFEQGQIDASLARGYFHLGELCSDTARKDRALKALEKAESMFQEMGMDYWLRRTQEVLLRVQG